MGVRGDEESTIEVRARPSGKTTIADNRKRSEQKQEGDDMFARRMGVIGLAMGLGFGVAIAGCGEDDSMEDTFDRARGNVETGLETAADRAGHAVDEVSDMADDMVDDAGELVDDTIDGAKKTARKAGDAVEDAGESAADGLEDAKDDLSRNWRD
jgi:hypothetical protein